jgi:hypothetical protein
MDPFHKPLYGVEHLKQTPQMDKDSGVVYQQSQGRCREGFQCNLQALTTFLQKSISRRMKNLSMLSYNYHLLVGFIVSNLYELSHSNS